MTIPFHSARRLDVLRLGAACLWASALWAACPSTAAASTPEARTGESVEQVAAAVDAVIADGLAEQGVTPAPLVDDLTYLRRVYFDIAGRPPTESVARAALDGLDRRATVDDLLKSPDFGRAWGAYWREVVLARAGQPESERSAGRFEAWLAEQINAGRAWDAIVRDILTASGDIRDNGAAGFVAAYDGHPETLAGEVSRLFLGTQISCANCHDHPYDAWSRDDFHGFAAYFSGLRRTLTFYGGTTSVVIHPESRDAVRTDARTRPERLIRLLDKNGDDALSAAEAKRDGSKTYRQFVKYLKEVDADGDDRLDEFELSRLKPGRSSDTAYFLPSPDDPRYRGERVAPRMFYGAPPTRRPSKYGDTDETLRAGLAEAVTGTSNVWFDRAIVNRLWAELTGAAFLAPIEDLGPEREFAMKAAFDLLVDDFRANGRELPRLFEVITATETYARAIAPDGTYRDSAFAAASATRLRGDQIYGAFAVALADPSVLTVPSDDGMWDRRRRPAAGGMMAGRAMSGGEMSGRMASDGRMTARPAVSGGKPRAAGGAMSIRRPVPRNDAEPAEDAIPPELRADFRALRYALGKRFRFADRFGYDPAVPKAEATGDAAQALHVMNHAALFSHLRAIGAETAELDSDREMIESLYLRFVTRLPDEAERAIASDFFAETPRERDAATDLAWVLANHVEFVTRR